MALKFRKDSWHRRLNEYVYGTTYDNRRTSLCPYFWGTVLAAVVFPAVWLVVNVLQPLGRRLTYLSKRAAQVLFLGILAIILTLVEIVAVLEAGPSVLVVQGVAFGFAAALIGTGVAIIYGLSVAYDRYVSPWLAARDARILERELAIQEAEYARRLELIRSGKWEPVPEPLPKIRKVRPVKVRKPRQPSILLAMVKAKKNSVCPYIEWEA